MTFVHDFFLPGIMRCKVVDIVGCHCCIPLCGWIIFMPYILHFISLGTTGTVSVLWGPVPVVLLWMWVFGPSQSALLAMC